MVFFACTHYSNLHAQTAVLQVPGMLGPWYLRLQDKWCCRALTAIKNVLEIIEKSQTMHE